MSNDFTPINTTSDAPMFAPVPSWERGKKRRTFGARSSQVAAEERSFAPAEAAPIPTRPVTLSEDARAYEARLDTVDPTETSFAAAPVYASATARRNNGSAPIALAAGVILLGGLAAAGWYAYQPHNTGVAELTPGSAATTTTTTQVASATPSQLQVAQAAPEPVTPVAPARAATVTTRTPAGAASRTTVTRARPAVDASADASAIAPAPAPSAAPPPAAAAPAPLVLTIPPAAPAEAPLPTQSTPAPAPTQTPPN